MGLGKGGAAEAILGRVDAIREIDMHNRTEYYVMNFCRAAVKEVV
jgi:hypothetical protein